MKTNFEAAKNFIKMKRMHNNESLSGPGSHLSQTSEAIHFINKIIREKNIKSILDLGCGDWNWFRLVNLEDATYEGWDCDEQMINDNTSKYGNNNVSFKVKDIFTEPLPDVDMIICRDVLFHIDKKLSSKLVEDIKVSSKYFLSTTFHRINENKNIKSYTNFNNWGYYEINLNIEPFNLSEYKIDEVEEKHAGKGRFMCLYHLI